MKTDLYNSLQFFFTVDFFVWCSFIVFPFSCFSHNFWCSTYLILLVSVWVCSNFLDSSPNATKWLLDWNHKAMNTLLQIGLLSIFVANLQVRGRDSHVGGGLFTHEWEEWTSSTTQMDCLHKFFDRVILWETIAQWHGISHKFECFWCVIWIIFKFRMLDI